MNLRDLEYLVAVADRRSFRQAAAACEVSQPTLSTQVKKLEGELGVMLVDRSVAPLALTPVGEKVVARARTILDDVEQIRTLTSDASDAGAAALRLGMFPTLGPYLLPHVLGEFRQRFGKVKLLLTEEKTADLMALLDAGRLDAVLVAMPVSGPHLHVEPLFSEQFLLAVSQGHPLDAEGPVSADEVARHEMLLLSAGHCLGDQVGDWMELHGAACREDYRATSLETMRNMVAAGSGITLLPALTVVPPVNATAGTVIRRFTDPAPSRQIALVWRRTSPRAELLASIAPALIPRDDDLIPPGLVTPLWTPEPHRRASAV